MSFLKEISEFVNASARGGWSETTTGRINNLGDSATQYDVDLRGGTRVNNIEGPAGLSPGARVTVAKYSSGKYVILRGSSGRRNTSMLTVSV
jgi:formylmethanofuran dehydrogenase subunit C